MRLFLCLCTGAALLASVACSNDEPSSAITPGPDTRTASSSSSSSGDHGASSSSSGEPGASSSGEPGASSSSSSSGDHGASSSSSGEPGAPSTACVGLVPTGEFATVTGSSATPPGGFGGTLLDGTYQLTNAILYGVPSAALSSVKLRATLVVAGSDWTRAVGAQYGASGEVINSRGGSWAPVDAALHASENCSDGPDDRGLVRIDGEYTVVSDHLTVHGAAPSGIPGATSAEYTFRRVP